MRYRTGFLAGMVGVLISVASSQAGKLYQYTGKVVNLKDDSITLRNGEEVLEFSRDASRGSRDLQGVKAGDEITIWYTLDAQKLKAQDDSKQEPGQAPSDKSPGEKKGVIVDDRAFYDAHNEYSEKNGASPKT